MKKRKTVVFFVLLLLGVVFLTYGIAEGGYTATLQKAKYICLECIGIG